MPEYTKQSPETISSLFDTIARDYDRGNALISFSLHRLWNRALVSALQEKKPKVFADLCGGTGAITARLCKNFSIEKSYIVDFSKGMLKIAQESLSHLPIETLAADVSQIPLKDQSIDAAAMAYGIRNVKNRPLAFKEAYRILKEGGTFAILELTRPQNPLLRLMHKAYLSAALPLIGKLVTKNKEAYSYLSNSVKEFVPAQTLVEEISNAGFIDISVRPMSLGAVTLITASKRF